MRVLYLCHRIPYPPNKGDKIRAYRELRAISEQHEVDLFTLADRSTDLQGELPLRHCCRSVTVADLSSIYARLRILPLLFTDKPLTIPYFYSSELDVKVRYALLRRSYDRIFVYCSSMAQYVRGIRDIPAILDFVDVDSDKWSQYSTHSRFPLSAIYRREARCLRNYERRLCRRYPNVLVTTDREAQLVRKIWERTGVYVIPNGVDAEYFKPSMESPCPAEPGITFIGDMAYFPNQEAVTFFALRVLPLIRCVVPNARFYIVGRNPTRRVLRLGRIDGVTVTGAVPDVRPYLAKALLSVAPFSIAAGIQNKILEAMAYGLPVVATPRAAQGLADSVAEAVNIGQTPNELAELVISLLRNPDQARREGLEARQRVIACYSWEHSLARVLELLENAGSPERRGPLTTLPLTQETS
jgi:sugar transferase (PEP-CTERM/EpsH1 system associated)